MYCLELFNIYKKLKYIRKLKLVEKFDKMLCAVKKLCSKKNVVFQSSMVNTTVAIDCKVNMKYIKYLQLYGTPENGCFDEKLLAEL